MLPPIDSFDLKTIILSLVLDKNLFLYYSNIWVLVFVRKFNKRCNMNSLLKKSDARNSCLMQSAFYGVGFMCFHTLNVSPTAFTGTIIFPDFIEIDLLCKHSFKRSASVNFCCGEDH